MARGRTRSAAGGARGGTRGARGARGGGGENSAIRERRRQQLIESTMASIAKRGFAETTMADVAKGAKLSHGIVNFHFKSKDQLLIETLRHLTEEYRGVWTRAVAKAGPGAADKLLALYLADFDPAVCTHKKLAVWHAFYGESKSRPTYLDICSTSDQERIDAGIELVREVIEEGDYDNLSPDLTARGFDALTEGLWQELLLSTDKFDREGARETVRTFLACVFPKHFPMTERNAA